MYLCPHSEVCQVEEAAIAPAVKDDAVLRLPEGEVKQ